MTRARTIGRACAWCAALLTALPASVLPEEPAKEAGFMPGDRVIFFDDFTQADPGGFPTQWTLKGPGGGGNLLSVVSRDGRSFLASQTPPEDDEQTPSTIYARLPGKEYLPDAFTIEFDAVLGFSRLVDDLRSERQYGIVVGAGGSSYALLDVSSQRAISRNSQSALDLGAGGTHHVAVSVQGRLVTAYIDGRRVLSDPDGVERPIARIGLELSSYKGMRQDDLMFTGFRVAELRAQQIAR